MKAFPGIQKRPDVCGGDACVGNSRVPVWTLVSFRKQGLSDGEILGHYPILTKGDLQAAWNYYAKQRQEIEDAIQQNDQAMNDEAL